MMRVEEEVEMMMVKEVQITRVLLVAPTQPAPGHDGFWVSGGDALQDGRLVNIDGEVLRSRQDDGLLVDPGGCAWSHEENIVMMVDTGLVLLLPSLGMYL